MRNLRSRRIIKGRVMGRLVGEYVEGVKYVALALPSQVFSKLRRRTKNRVSVSSPAEKLGNTFRFNTRSSTSTGRSGGTPAAPPAVPAAPPAGRPDATEAPGRGMSQAATSTRRRRGQCRSLKTAQNVQKSPDRLPGPCRSTNKDLPGSIKRSPMAIRSGDVLQQAARL